MLSIESLLNQSAGVSKITVLDNESTDNTFSVVERFSSRGVRYIRTKGFLGNFKKAQEIASGKYVMLFHDDDILHPLYLELALRAQDRERYSKEELLKLARKRGINTWGSCIYCKYRCKNKTVCKRQDFIRRLILKGKTKLET